MWFDHEVLVLYENKSTGDIQAAIDLLDDTVGVLKSWMIIEQLDELWRVIGRVIFVASPVPVEDLVALGCENYP